jgi:hypothetical protein
MYPREYFDNFWQMERTDQLFVAMSFHAAFESIWQDAFVPAATGSGLKPFRVDMEVASTSIITSIVNGIVRSRLVLVDVSDMPVGTRGAGAPNGNVLYELGLSHALRQAAEVLVVSGSANQRLPFDISPIRVHRYAGDDPSAASSLVGHLIRDSLRDIEATKSLQVERAAARLDQNDVGFIARWARENQFPVFRGGFSEGLRLLVGQSWPSASRGSVTRLIELGLVKRIRYRMRLSGEEPHRPENYIVGAYEWTALGTAVIEYLFALSRHD